jgi:hypothetical protein
MAQGVVHSTFPELPIVHLSRLVETGTWLVIGGAIVGGAVALLVRWLGGSWTFGLLALAAVPGLTLLSWRAQVCSDAYAAAVVGVGAWRHAVDVRAGGDLAQRARARGTPLTPIRRWLGWRRLRNGGWVTSEGVAIGFTRKGELVPIPVAGSRSVMSLMLGATGSGKTILQVLLALAAIKRGMAVIYIDPKGDDFVREELRPAAEREAGGFALGIRRARRSTTPTAVGRTRRSRTSCSLRRCSPNRTTSGLRSAISGTSSGRCGWRACRSAS